MPVFNGKTIKNAPEWVDISAYGVGCIKKGNSVEEHFHDAHEYWFIVSGRAAIKTEGETVIVGPGEVVCTKMGDNHELMEILDEELVIVWLEARLKGKKRAGHLHAEDR
jgi:mannose-6-phosphate isomerase-like protein (cupin superfamily)